MTDEWIKFIPKKDGLPVGPVPTHPSTVPVEQPIDLFFNGPAYTTFLHVGITAWPIAPLVGSLFNRPQG
jgi:hypothetical protein